MTDVITEMLVGQDGAVRVACKSILFSVKGVELQGKPMLKTMFGSVIVHPEPLFLQPQLQLQNYEMWEGTMILIPKRKYRDCRDFEALSFDEMFLDRDWYQRYVWKEQIFGEAPPVEKERE